MLHYLYRIFYMAPNDQEVQVFEWHNFFDIHHDFPMRVHIDNTDDHKKCATMADIIAWFTKPEKDRNALRRLGMTPKLIYCLGCKTVEEREFLSLMTLKKMAKPVEEPAPFKIKPISSKAAKRLGMSPMEMADAAVSCSNLHAEPIQAQNNYLSSVIGFPLRRSASALLFPVTDLLEHHCIKQPETIVTDTSMWPIEKASSSYDLNKPDAPPKPKTSKASALLPSIVFGDSSAKLDPNEPLRKNGTVDMPILKQSEAHKKSIARRKRHERLLKASEWYRITDEEKATLVEIKIRQRILLIQHYIRGWQDMGAKDACVAKWLAEDLCKPLHSRRFASFEYHHFIPSHVLQILTKLNKVQMEKYAKNYLVYMQRVESLNSYSDGRGELQKRKEDNAYNIS
ncbi:hypothetical protein GCK72_025111 [Caenorhabditis remanei]|uniref:Uncharacterized protein n=1 Tax=Caenorhabditis remanei TaxID=31234 RepID=A0A6A5G1Z8_CAERE|nr:hypothetical protein GCK72_025111 [Caenorhabditis remanei]KAF1748644.1 hypothetical protein GCK72_025111 [Caenorhabditis remanei]